MKKDSIVIGIIMGTVAPLLGVMAFYFWKAGSINFLDFLNVVIRTNSLLTAMISFALVANAVVFTWMANSRKDKSAKGIFIMTLIIAIPLIVYKIFFY